MESNVFREKYRTQIVWGVTVLVLLVLAICCYFLFLRMDASAFIGEGKNSVDGILLRTDIERSPTMIYHILLHELAHVFLRPQ